MAVFIKHRNLRLLHGFAKTFEAPRMGGKLGAAREDGNSPVSQADQMPSRFVAALKVVTGSDVAPKTVRNAIETDDGKPAPEQPVDGYGRIGAGKQHPVHPM